MKSITFFIILLSAGIQSYGQSGCDLVLTETGRDVVHWYNQAMFHSALEYYLTHSKDESLTSKSYTDNTTGLNVPIGKSLVGFEQSSDKHREFMKNLKESYENYGSSILTSELKQSLQSNLVSEIAIDAWIKCMQMQQSPFTVRNISKEVSVGGVIMIGIKWDPKVSSYKKDPKVLAFVTNGIESVTGTLMQGDVFTAGEERVFKFKRIGNSEVQFVIEVEGTDAIGFYLPKILSLPELPKPVTYQSSFTHLNAYNSDCSEITGSSENGIKCICHDDIGVSYFGQDVLNGPFRISFALSCSWGTSGLTLLPADYLDRSNIGETLFKGHLPDEFVVSQNNSFPNYYGVSEAGQNLVSYDNCGNGSAYYEISRNYEGFITIYRNGEQIYPKNGKSKKIEGSLRILGFLQCPHKVNASKDDMTYLKNLKIEPY